MSFGIGSLGTEPLRLRNSGKLEIFFIGVGSAFAATLNQTNFLIIKGDTHLMVDFGMTGPRALAETARLKVTDLENFFLSHSHADHIGGIECAALTNRYVGRKFMNKPKLTALITEEYQRVLWDYSLRGGMEANEEEGETRRRLSFGDFFRSVRPVWKKQQPREIHEADFGPIHLEIFRTKHVPDSAGSWEASFISYGLYLDNRVFVSIDTRFDLELVEMYAHRSEVMFHDVQFFPGGVHAPLEDLKTLSPWIKEKMYLMHYSDNWREQDISDFAGWTLQGHRYIFG